MGENSKIQWTDHTFNPVWGCVKVSPGCQHCYAETLSKRFGKNIWGPNSSRRTFKDAHWKEPLKWNAAAEREGKRAKVFCASMADIGEDHPDWEEPRRRTFELIQQTPALDWLLLTKRPEFLLGEIAQFYIDRPPRNLWFGFSAENQDYFYKRWKAVEPFARYFSVVFISAEPLLGPIFIENNTLNLWWIDGGESGPKCRPANPAWFRYHRDQCRNFDIPYFLKQLGGHPDKRGDIEQFPEDLRIREFPDA